MTNYIFYQLLIKTMITDKNVEADKIDKVEKVDVTDRIIIGGENEIKSNGTNNRLSNELLQKFSGKSREVCTFYKNSILRRNKNIIFL